MNAPLEIVNIEDERFLYPSGKPANKNDSNLNKVCHKIQPGLRKRNGGVRSRDEELRRNLRRKTGARMYSY